MLLVAESFKIVLPAEAGTQEKQGAPQPLGPRFRGDDNRDRFYNSGFGSKVL